MQHSNWRGISLGRPASHYPYRLPPTPRDRSHLPAAGFRPQRPNEDAPVFHRIGRGTKTTYRRRVISMPKGPSCTFFTPNGPSAFKIKRLAHFVIAYSKHDVIEHGIPLALSRPLVQLFRIFVGSLQTEREISAPLRWATIYRIQRIKYRLLSSAPRRLVSSFF